MTGVNEDIVVLERIWNMLLLAVLSVSVAFESLLLTRDVGLGRGGWTAAFGDDIDFGLSYVRRTKSGLA